MGSPKIAVPVRWRPEGVEARCPTCQMWWNLTDEFWVPLAGMRRCRSCHNEYHRLRQAGLRHNEATGVVMRARQRMNYAQHREKRKAASRAWREANPEKVKAARRAYYLKHRQLEIDRARVYNVEAREVIRMKKYARRHSEKAA